MRIHNEFITLFKADDTGYEFFHRVVTERFNFRHVHVSCMVTPKRYVDMELACSCCYRYVAREYDSRCATLAELQEVRATLLLFITECEYTHPGSDALPQR